MIPIKNWKGIWVLSVVALCVSVISFFVAKQPEELFQISLHYKGEQEIIKTWMDENGDYYVFLPDYVDMENVNVSLNTNSAVYIDGKRLSDGFRCNVFSENTSYNLEYMAFGKKQCRKITFFHTGTVASLFVKTESMGMEYIHGDKEHKEAGLISLFSQTGDLDYKGSIEYIKGRGNYTWEESDKKPYNIVLAESADLLNMGMGSKWVLLANALDSTLMRNKIVYDFASRIGMDYTPESQWVALYLNGEYRGLYMLCEAIEIGADRVDISQEGGMVVAVEGESALQEKGDIYFVTDAGVAVGVKSPKTVSADKVASAAKRLQAVENAILSPVSEDPLTGAALEELIDWDSWVDKYLIEEVFGNHDAFMRSTYYYYQDETSVLCAGPVWDHDYSIGNENAWQLRNPQTFWANRLESQPGTDMPWGYALYQKDEFYQDVVEKYRTVFLAEIEQLISETIPAYTREISEAAAADKIRWNDESNLEKYVDLLCKYLKERIEFLNGVWIDQRDYCVVRAVQQWGGYYAYYVVFTGDTLPELPEFDNNENQRFVGWYDEKTGEPFDATKPITEDIEIYARWEDKPAKKLNQVLSLVPIGIISAMGVGLAWIEVKRLIKSR